MGDECAALYADGIGEDAPRHVLTLLVPGSVVSSCGVHLRNLKEANKPETGKQRSKKQHITIVNNHFNIIKPKHEWIIQDINISEKFYNYQLSVLETLKTTGLTWHHTYDILALSNIIILTQQCPYQNFFTRKGWKIIIDTNPYKLKDPGIPPSMLASLHDAALKHLCGKDSLIYPDQTPLSRISLRAFNELRESVPNLAPKIMS
ncbi:unnamed protein product [Rhizophagus irregularis]|uniref:Uncharacterized protein n=1 Tax=Rhizophagus irregularis TaxID=588596 RepID=A0A915YWH0_9GLOM|nr:unnamed protein product [Rhizophagus irregularis]CAB5349150.1 unnamed protein product [Rhizophagus irregularis]